METKKQAGFAQRARKVVTGNPIVFLLLIAAIVVGCLKDNFFSWANFSNLVSNTAIRFLIALAKGIKKSRHRTFGTRNQNSPGIPFEYAFSAEVKSAGAHIHVAAMLIADTTAPILRSPT